MVGGRWVVRDRAHAGLAVRECLASALGAVWTAA
jgi:hypothetical protein